MDPGDYRKGDPKPRSEPILTPNAPVIIAVLFVLAAGGWMMSKTVVPMAGWLIAKPLEALGLPLPRALQEPQSQPRQQ